MNQLAFIMSSILVLIGVILIALGQLVQAVLPRIGYMAFLVAKSGSYSENDYALNLGVYYSLAVLCLVGGFVLSARFYQKSIQENREQGR